MTQSLYGYLRNQHTRLAPYHSLLTAHPALQHTSHSRFDTRSHPARPPCSLAAPVIYSTRLVPGLSPSIETRPGGLTERFMAQLRPFVGALPPAATALGSSPRNQTQTGGLECGSRMASKALLEARQKFLQPRMASHATIIFRLCPVRLPGLIRWNHNCPSSPLDSRVTRWRPQTASMVGY